MTHSRHLQDRYKVEANYTVPSDEGRPANASQFLQRFFVSASPCARGFEAWAHHFLDTPLPHHLLDTPVPHDFLDTSVPNDLLDTPVPHHSLDTPLAAP